MRTHAHDLIDHVRYACASARADVVPWYGVVPTKKRIITEDQMKTELYHKISQCFSSVKIAR